MRFHSAIARLAGGAGAGMVGTVAMSLPMLAARRLGLTPTLPPEVIVARTTHLEAGSGRDTVTVAGHLGFGAVCGALLALVPSVRGSRPVSVATGVGAGLTIWAASYAGWIPALGLLPPPERDHPGRRRTMVASHVVFGAATALGIRGIERRR